MPKKRKRSLPRDFVFKKSKPKVPAFINAPQMPVPRSLHAALHIESDEAIDMALASGVPVPDRYKRFLPKPTTCTTTTED